MAFSPLNSSYSPLNAVTAALPLNVLAGDLKPFLMNIKLCACSSIPPFPKPTASDYFPLTNRWLNPISVRKETSVDIIV